VIPGPLIDGFLLGERRFSHAETVQIAGAVHATLQNWANPKRGFLDPYLIPAGRRGWREYTSTQVAAIFVTVNLVERGLQPAIAYRIAMACVDAVDHAANAARHDRASGSAPGEPTFYDEVEDYLTVVWGPVREQGSFHVRLVRKSEIADFDFASDSHIVVPSGKMLVEVARRAAKLRKVEV
jgi:hypothetical protein